MSSGGGGQSGVTRYDWNPVIGGYWGNGEKGNGVLSWAEQEAQKPWQSNPYKQVVGFGNDFNWAADTLRGNFGQGGSVDTLAGRQQNIDTAQGKYLNANPGANGVNQFQGMENPYFRKSLQSGLEDITSAYKQGTAADTTRMFNLAGAFGGSAHQNAVANNENALARNLGRTANEAYQQQYDRSANMDESRLGRVFGAYEGERGRMVNGAQSALQGDALSRAMIGDMMGLDSQIRGLGQQRADLAANNWNEQQNWGRNNVDWLANILGRAQGSTGIQTQFGGYQSPNYGSQALGLGLLGRSAGLF